MQKETPKPFLQLSGSTILEHTIRRFLPLEQLRQVIIPTSEEYLATAQQLLDEILSDEVQGICLVGGSERQDSIYNALKKVNDVELVIVHDAVRPFVKLNHITNCCRVASEMGAAVVGVPAKDTIKKINDEQEIVETPSRKYLWQTQTPQIFRRSLIMER